MPGLRQAMLPPAGDPNAQPIDDGGMSQGEQATPEEQALYEQFLNAAGDVIYPNGDKPSPEIIANLKGDIDPQAMQMFADAQPPVAQSPQDAVSATAVLLTMLVDGQGKASGTDYPDDVVLHAGAGIIEILVDISEAAKIHDFSEQEMEGLTYRAMDLFRIASPRVDTEALKGEFGQIVAADKSGQLNKVLPGLPGGPPMQAG